MSSRSAALNKEIFIRANLGVILPPERLATILVSQMAPFSECGNSCARFGYHNSPVPTLPPSRSRPVAMTAEDGEDAAKLTANDKELAIRAPPG